MEIVVKQRAPSFAAGFLLALPDTKRAARERISMHSSQKVYPVIPVTSYTREMSQGFDCCRQRPPARRYNSAFNFVCSIPRFAVKIPSWPNILKTCSSATPSLKNVLSSCGAFFDADSARNQL